MTNYNYNYNYNNVSTNTNAFAENLEPRHSGEELLDLSAIGYHANKPDCAELQSPADGNGIAKKKKISGFQKEENGDSVDIYGVEKGTFPVVCSDNTDGSRIKLKGSTITKAIEYIANNTIFTIAKNKDKQVTIGGTNFGTVDDDIKYVSLILVGAGGSAGGSSVSDTGCVNDCGQGADQMFPGTGGGGGGIFTAILDVEHYSYTIKLGKGGAGVSNAVGGENKQKGENGNDGEDSVIFSGDSYDWKKVIAVVHGGKGGKGGDYDKQANASISSVSAIGGDGGNTTVYDDSHLIKYDSIAGGAGSDVIYNENENNINVSQKTTIRPLSCGKNGAIRINRQLDAAPASATEIKNAIANNFTFCVPGGNSFGNGGYAEISRDIVQAATNPLYGGGGGDFYSKNTTTVTSSQSGANGCAVFFY